MGCIFRYLINLTHCSFMMQCLVPGFSACLFVGAYVSTYTCVQLGTVVIGLGWGGDGVILVPLPLIPLACFLVILLSLFIIFLLCYFGYDCLVYE